MSLPEPNLGVDTILDCPQPKVQSYITHGKVEYKVSKNHKYRQTRRPMHAKTDLAELKMQYLAVHCSPLAKVRFLSELPEQQFEEGPLGEPQK